MDTDFPDIAKGCKKATRSSELVELKKKSPNSKSMASLELLNKYGDRMKRMNGKQLNDFSYTGTCNSTGANELSTTEIMKSAAAKYRSYISRSSGDLSMLIDHFNGDHSGRSCEVTEDVELVLLLLVSADRVANRRYDRARKFLSMCCHMASCKGNPVQRVVYYFAEALQERVDRKAGIISSERLKGNRRWISHLEEAITTLQPSILAYRQELPFYLVTQSVGMQAIMDNMSSAKRIHLVDLGIRSGSHWTILMQALAVRDECPLESLKITAVGTASRKQMIEETGRRLLCFAETLNLPFSFKIVLVPDMNDLKEHMFEVEAGETVGFHSSMLSLNLIAGPSHLETLIRVIEGLCPVVMVITELEAHINSPDFMDRFIEALFFYGANFDALDACMERCNPNRMTMEAVHFRGGIQNVINIEADERTTWHMKIDGWRDLFNKFGLVETELSTSSLCQANLVVKNSPCGRSCTLDMDGKCLIVGWKGTPVFSLSAWKFHSEIEEQV